MKRGPRLNKARYWHGCARIKDNSIIVVGGRNDIVGNNNYLKSTEILRIGELEWTNGPDLKEGVRLNEVVKSNGEDYIAYSIAGNTEYLDHSDKIHGLRSDRTEWELIDVWNGLHRFGSVLNVPLKSIPWCEI